MKVLVDSLQRLLKNKWIYPLVCGGIFFLVFSNVRLLHSDLDPYNFTVRDDGVITLAHVKNLVDYGFIGINPSGERVEGYSTPLQFSLATALYWAFGIDFVDYANIQTWLFTFLLGVVLSLFFIECRAFGYAAVFLSALFLTHFTSFFQWHSSGFENPLTHVTFAAAVLVLYQAAKSGKVSFWLIPIVFLSTTSRIEAVFHVAPLLVLFSVFWFFTQRNLRAFYFSLGVFVLWCGVQGLRYSYFGDILPNTAYGQSISLADNFRMALALDPGYLRLSFGVAYHVFTKHGGLFLPFVLLGLLFIKRDRPIVFVLVLLGSLITTATINSFFFGCSRFDPTRSTTHFAVSVTIALSLIACRLVKIQVKKKYLLIGLGVIFALAFGMRIPSYYVCCYAHNFEKNNVKVIALAEKHQFYRATLANPDIGAMAWHKQYNIVDLAALGSPILAKLNKGEREGKAMAKYFFDYARPDIVEGGTVWICSILKHILRNPRFLEDYEPIETRFTKVGFCPGGPIPHGMWVRKDVSLGAETPERRLMDDLRLELSMGRLRIELEQCAQRRTERCSYVARAAYRHLPELIAMGHYEELKRLFSKSPTSIFDRYLISGRDDGQLHERVMEMLLAEVSAEE